MLDVRVLGELEMQLDGESLELPRSTRACALLGWLALHPGLHARSKLAALFWPEVLDSSARASLRSALWALRSSCGPRAGSSLHTDRERVGLTGDDLVVDAREFNRLVSGGRFAEAVALCHGPVLYQFDDDWVFTAREEHDDQLAAALAGLASQARATGDLPAAERWAGRRAALRPLDEAAARELIELRAALDDLPGALAAYQRLRQRLRDELGVTPSAATERVAGRLVVGVPDRPAAKTATDPDGHDDKPPLVGRERELALLVRSWRAASAGRGHAVVITGAGGIGKTRLSTELISRASGARTATGVADGLGVAAPFGLWAELLADLIAQVGAPPAAVATELGRVIPSAGARGARVRPARPAGDPKLDRVRFFEAVVELISWASPARPLLLVLEDVHLADRSSLEATAYVGRRIARLPVLLVLTRRRLPARADVDAVLAVLRSRGALDVELELGPLRAQSVRQLARATAGLTGQDVEQIVAIAAGSPLIATETSRAYARGDPAAGLREATRSAIGRLRGPARRFVELTAVAGRDLDRSEIAVLSMTTEPAAAIEALGADLLRERDGAIGFRHALLRDAVYDDLAPPARAQLHEVIAQALRGRPGHRASQRAAEVARHFRLAGRDDLAVDQLSRAAAEARLVAALTEAAAYLAEAVQIDPDDPDLLVELAEVQAWRGLPKASDFAFERAIECTPAADCGALASAWTRRARWMQGALCYPRESRKAYQNALHALDRDPIADPVARAETLAGMAWSEAVAGDPNSVERLLVEISELTGHDHPGDLLTHDVGSARGLALIRAGRFTQSYGPLIAAGAAAERAGRPDMAYGCLANAAGAAACAGELERALEFADRCAAVVLPNGLMQPGVYIQTGRAAILRRLGRLDEASAACEHAATLADRVGLVDLEGLVHHERGLLALARDEPATAAAEFQVALELGAPVSRPLARLLRAEALARACLPAESEVELRSVALEPVSANDFPDTLVARMSFVEALIAQGRGDHALAERRLRDAEAGWRRRVETRAAGEGYALALVDLGRPPISSLVEPDQELARVRAELAAFTP